MPSPSLSYLLASLLDAPPTLVRFATRSGLPDRLANALPTTVTDLTFGLKRGSDLGVVMDRWFGRRRVEEVGTLRRVLLLRVTEDELVRDYAKGSEFLETLAQARCDIKFFRVG